MCVRVCVYVCVCVCVCERERERERERDQRLICSNHVTTGTGTAEDGSCRKDGCRQVLSALSGGRIRGVVTECCARDQEVQAFQHGPTAQGRTSTFYLRVFVCMYVCMRVVYILAGRDDEVRNLTRARIMIFAGNWCG